MKNSLYIFVTVCAIIFLGGWGFNSQQGIFNEHPFIPQPYETLEDSTQQSMTKREYEQLISWYKTESDVSVISFSYKSDGLIINGIRAQPKPQKSAKYPVIIYNRGSASGDGITLSQLQQNIYPLVKKNYVIIASQYRQGGGSQGVDEFGGADVHDVLRLYEIVKTLPYVDTKNIFILGYSRGSIMTYRMLQQQTPVNAAATIGGVTDLFTLEDFGERVLLKFGKLVPTFGKSRDVELAKRSAIRWVQSFNVPLLLLHGQDDKTVSVQQSEKLARELEKHNKTVKLITYPGCDHPLKGHCQQMLDAVDEWFRKYKN